MFVCVKVIVVWLRLLVVLEDTESVPVLELKSAVVLTLVEVALAVEVAKLVKANMFASPRELSWNVSP